MQEQITINCKHCNRPFEYYAKDNKRPFCSHACYGKDRTSRGVLTTNCSYCTKVIPMYKYEKESRKKRFCSKQCFNKWQTTDANIGENNPNYNRVRKSCLTCKKEFITFPKCIRKGAGKFCSV